MHYHPWYVADVFSVKSIVPHFHVIVPRTWVIAAYCPQLELEEG
jgi:hypothetical protein